MPCYASCTQRQRLPCMTSSPTQHLRLVCCNMPTALNVAQQRRSDNLLITAKQIRQDLERMKNHYARVHAFKLSKKELLSMQAFSYRGPGDPSEESLHYIIQTSSAKQQLQQPCNIPTLPSGSLVTGLAAAAIQYSQVQPAHKC